MSPIDALAEWIRNASPQQYGAACAAASMFIVAILQGVFPGLMERLSLPLLLRRYAQRKTESDDR